MGLVISSDTIYENGVYKKITPKKAAAPKVETKEPEKVKEDVKTPQNDGKEAPKVNGEGKNISQYTSDGAEMGSHGSQIPQTDNSKSEGEKVAQNTNKKPIEPKDIIDGSQIPHNEKKKTAPVKKNTGKGGSKKSNTKKK